MRACARFPRRPPPPFATPRQQSKLYALLHSGLAFRYSCWQHTAALQALLVAVAAGLTTRSGPCTHPALEPLQPEWTAQQAATLLTSSGLPAYAAAAAAGNGASVGGGEGGEGGALPLLLSVPAGINACVLVLTWAQVGPRPPAPAMLWLGSAGTPAVRRPHRLAHRPPHSRTPSLVPARPQVCLGIVVPLWAAVLGEEYARARFAAANVAHLQPSEKEWAVMAATGAEWLAALFQLPLACLVVWYALLAAAAAACAHGLCLGAG